MTPTTNYIPFAKPDLDGSELVEIAAVLESGWVTSGPKTKQFEKEFATAVGAKHAIALNSCTAAMHLALEAIGLQAGEEVITTPYTFAATAEVIRYFDARPVLADIDPLTLNIDPREIEAAITPKTRAILPVHIAGMPADMPAIRSLARQHDLAVIEDAAHALPYAVPGNPIGAMSDFTCYSFYATKNITTGEGGMLCTDNDEWAERCRIMALHGISADAWKRYTAEGSWYYEIVAPGFKYNMTDIAAAMGLAQLRRAKTMWRRRLEIATRYQEAFASVTVLQTPHDRGDLQHAWHLYTLRLHLDRLQIDRARFVEELREHNIGVSVHFIPLHIHPYYREKYGYRPQDFPLAFQEYTREISLPIYSKMSDEDIAAVITAVVDIARQYARQ